MQVLQQKYAKNRTFIINTFFQKRQSYFFRPLNKKQFELVTFKQKKAYQTGICNANYID